MPDAAASVGHSGREVMDGGGLVGSGQPSLVVLSTQIMRPQILLVIRRANQVQIFRYLLDASKFLLVEMVT